MVSGAPQMHQKSVQIVVMIGLALSVYILQMIMVLAARKIGCIVSTVAVNYFSSSKPT